MTTKLHFYYVCAGVGMCLGLAHMCSMVDGSVCGSPMGYKLVDSAGLVELLSSSGLSVFLQLFHKSP